MPVYLFTFHAYRSWSPDHPKGFVTRTARLHAPDHKTAEQYASRATQSAVEFTDELQHILIEGTRDICTRRDWRPHFMATEPTHIHLLISWNDDTLDWKTVHDTLKRLLGMMLTQHTGQRGRKWFARKGSRRRVKDREHFDHLMNEYLPKHRGRKWSERSETG